MIVLKIAGGIVLGFVVLIVGCSALVGAGVESVESDLDETAITAQQYTSAETGEMTKADLTEEFGEP